MPKQQKEALHLIQQPSSHTQRHNSRHIVVNDWIKMKIEIPKIYFNILYANMLASLFTWLLLAGFVVLPVTFASIRNSRAVSDIGKAGGVVINKVQNVPFLWLAASCFLCGAMGLLWLWWENRGNYIWLNDRIFLPALLNSMIGLVTTLISVYTTQEGHWSITATATAVVTATVTFICMSLYTLYALWTQPAWKEHCALNGKLQ